MLRNESVLVVEDDPAHRLVLGLALAAAGYDVVAAPGATEAAASVAENAPAVAIVSMELAGGASDAFVRALSHESPETEVVLLANPSSMDRLITLYDLRTLYNHRWRPVEDIGDLARDVARAMERRALKRQNSYLLTELRDTRDELRSQAEFMVQVERQTAVSRVVTACARSMGRASDNLNPIPTDPAHLAVVAIGKLHSGRTQGRKPGPAPEPAMAAALVLASLDPLADEPWEQFDLNSVLSEAMLPIRPLADENRVRVIPRLSAKQCLVHGSRPQVLEAALHLVLNAVDAMPHGGALTVSSEFLPGERPGVRFAVSDTGTGINPDILPRIFDPFFTTGVFGRSTGLGLWAVRNIVRHHDGEIAVDTSLGQGSTITVWIPAAAGCSVDGPRTKPALRAA